MNKAEIQKRLNDIDYDLHLIVADWASGLSGPADSIEVDSLVTAVVQRIMAAMLGVGASGQVEI